MLTREQLIQHIQMMNRTQPAYAEYILARYAARLPWMELPTYENLKGKP